MDYMLETKNLTKQFGKQTAVNQLNLKVERRSIYGLLGPNGSGKSTTLKMITGMLRKTSGHILIDGHDWSRKDLENIGALIESPPLYENLTARENLKVRTLMLGLPDSRIDEVLKIVDLTNTGKKRAGQFSMGMKQRLGLAAALLGNPRLVLLDEPTNGLDPEGIHEMRALVRALPQTHGTTVLVSSHLLAEVEQMADHLGIISRGQMVWQGPLERLRARARRQLAFRTTDDARAAALLGASAQDGWLLAPFAGDEAVAHSSLALARAGIGVVRIEERSESIEDLFLALTEGRGL